MAGLLPALRVSEEELHDIGAVRLRRCQGIVAVDVGTDEHGVESSDAGGHAKPPRSDRRVWRTRSSPPEQVVRHPARAGHHLVVEPIVELIRRLPQSRAGADLYVRGDRHMQGVDEIGVEELPDGRGPAAEPDVLAGSGLLGPRGDRDRICCDEMKGRIRQRELRPFMVRHDEHGSVERRLVAPPPLPFVVPPRTAMWAELVAPHDLCADVVAEIPREVVVEAASAARLGAVGPACCRAAPREHRAGVDVPERALEALVHPRTEPVTRHIEILDFEQLDHVFPLSSISDNDDLRDRLNSSHAYERTPASL